MPSLVTCLPTRVGLPQCGQTRATLAAANGASKLTMPPCGVLGVGLVCFLTMLTPATTTLFARGITRRILPVLPRSLPRRTNTVSSRRSFIARLPASPAGWRLLRGFAHWLGTVAEGSLHHLRRKRNNLL